MSSLTPFDDRRAADAPADSPLHAAKGGLRAEGGEGHIRATVEISNEGSQTLALVNPFEMVQWALTDSSGASVDLPSRAPNLLLHPANANWADDNPQTIDAVRVNNRTVDIAHLNDEVLALDSGAGWAVTFVIDRRMDGEPLASGQYKISASLPLIRADVRTESRQWHTKAVAVAVS